MKKLLAMGALAAATGCADPIGVPLKVDIAMDGYTAGCGDLMAETLPLHEDVYCPVKNHFYEADIPPSVYASHSDKFRAALDCAFEGIIQFTVNPNIQEAHRDLTLYIGGRMNDTVAGKNISSGIDGKFVSYVTDSFSWGPEKETRYVLQGACHEIGHGLINLALLQRGESCFSTYGLDEEDHEPRGSDSIMMTNSIYSSSLNFGEGSAQAIAENTDLSGTGMGEDELVQSLTTIEDRCRDEIDQVLAINPL